MLRSSRWRVVLAVAAACGPVAPHHAAADWLADGSPVAPSDSLQVAPAVAPDGAGGAFIAWQDFRSGRWVVYAQRVTGEGRSAPGWPLGGLAISSDWAQDPVIVADGRGGAFVAASDGRDVEVRHLGPDGGMAPRASARSAAANPGPATAIGEDVRTSSLQPAAVQKVDPSGVPVLIPDGSGGAFMAWEEGGWLRTFVSVGRVTSGGSLVPGWGGPAPGYSDKFAPVVCTDQADGVIVAWIWARGIRAARFDASGSLAPGWPDTGAVVCAAPGLQDALGIVSDDAGGAIVVWHDARNGSFEQVYAQRITAGGDVSPDWPMDGRVICAFASHPGSTRYPARRYGPARYSSVAPDGAGGALIVWTVETPDGGDIYGQHLQPDGSIAPGWGANGLPVCAAPGAQAAPTIAADGAGGAFVTWRDRRSLLGTAVYAQHLTGAGTPADGWPVEGIVVCRTPHDQIAPRVTADAAGGAIMVWQDLRCMSPALSQQVFVSRVGADGTLPTAPGVPTVFAALAGRTADAGTVHLTWQTMDASGLATTVYRRHVDGTWTPMGVRYPDADGNVTYADTNVIAGCRYLYGVRLPTCNSERILGEGWVDVPNDAGFRPVAVSSRSAWADAGRVNLAWRLSGGAGLAATLFHRDSCSGWTELGSADADATGLVTFEDRGRFEGHTETYRLRVHICGQDRELDWFATVIPTGAGFIPTTATLVHQEVGDGGVHLVWRKESGPPSVARLYRRDATTDWSLRASTHPDASGTIRFLDSTVLPATRYEYMLGLWSCAVEPRFGPTAIEVPASTPVVIHGVLSIRMGSPSPARGELTALITLPAAAPATIEVFDVRGRQILSRDVGDLGPGGHALVLADVSVLPPGFYLVRLSQEGQSRTVRAVLMR